MRWLLALAAVTLLGAQLAGFVHRVEHRADGIGTGIDAAAARTASAGGAPEAFHADRAADAHHCVAFDALALAAGPLKGCDPTTSASPARNPVVGPQGPVLLAGSPTAFRARAPPHRFS